MAFCTSLVWDKSQSENASSSPAKKQRCEDFPPPPTSLSEKTDPRSIIKVYNYDSDDEINYEGVDEFGMHEMTDQEFKEYSRLIKESEGFDVMDFPKSFSCGKIVPIINLNDHANHLKSLSELALKEYNEKEKTKLEFVKLVKANGEPCEGLQYYITFDVKDADAVDGPIQHFKLWCGTGSTGLKYCFVGWKLVINQGLAFRFPDLESICGTSAVKSTKFRWIFIVLSRIFLLLK